MPMLRFDIESERQLSPNNEKLYSFKQIIIRDYEFLRKCNTLEKIVKI
jgi:hypothetical protein